MSRVAVVSRRNRQTEYPGITDQRAGLRRKEGQEVSRIGLWGGGEKRGKCQTARLQPREDE